MAMEKSKAKKMADKISGFTDSIKRSTDEIEGFRAHGKEKKRKAPRSHRITDIFHGLISAGLAIYIKSERLYPYRDLHFLPKKFRFLVTAIVIAIALWPISWFLKNKVLPKQPANPDL
jgi:hypothetical protein